MSFLGLDLGGTKVSVGLLGSAGEFTPKSYEVVRDDVEIVDHLVSVIEDHRESDLRGVGLCVPGWMSLDRSEVLFAPHRPSLIGQRLAEILTNRIGVPVEVDNDANTAAYLEVQIGALQGIDCGVVVNFGTGLGVGVVLNGVVQRGAHGFAGEIGHSYFGGDDRCACGARGCLELALRHSFFTNDDARCERDARRERYLDLAGVALQWTVRAWDPSIIVIGGGIGVESSKFLADLESRLYDRLGATYPDSYPSLVRATALGHAGAYGAALMSAASMDR
ncbi:MAG: ROK family protein [Acidimicrobiales bacterium]